MTENFNEMAARQVAEARARAFARRLELSPAEEVEVDRLLALVEEALQNWRNRYGAPLPVQPTNFHTCEYESTYQDFDGVWASMVCGQPATQQVIVPTDYEADKYGIMEVCEWHKAIIFADFAIETGEVAQAWSEWDADH